MLSKNTEETMQKVDKLDFLEVDYPAITAVVAERLINGLWCSLSSSTISSKNYFRVLANSYIVELLIN